MTPLQVHTQTWKNCTACYLSVTRTRVCLVRGTVPCDVLFVGEAPGKSEDVLGSPFVGPAGQLLDRIVEQSMPEEYCQDCLDKDGKLSKTREVKDEITDGWTCLRMFHDACNLVRPRWAFTNLVGCVPVDPETGKKDGEPDDVSIKACAPRLQDLVKIADPKLVVCVGKLASGWLNTPMRKDTVKLHRVVRMVDVVHPAAILRAPQAQQGLMRKRCVVTISEAVEEL